MGAKWRGSKAAGLFVKHQRNMLATAGGMYLQLGAESVVFMLEDDLLNF